VTRIDHSARTATVRLDGGDEREDPYDVVIVGAGSAADGG
jgi:NADPH-dependent 2,4-dienoyl-CoA reductase/sulfur reductase-like enzyme